MPIAFNTAPGKGARRSTPSRKVTDSRDSKNFAGHATKVLTLECGHTHVRRWSEKVPKTMGCGKCVGLG